MLEALEGWAKASPSEKGVRIFGGIYAYELEQDPIKRAAMKAEVEADLAAEDEFFEAVVRPRIRTWWSQQ